MKDKSNDTPPPQPILVGSEVLRKIKTEAYQREAVPSASASKDVIRGTALALSARLGAIERMCREALKAPPSPTKREE